MATTVAVIVAGGRGERLQGPSDIPKQYLPLAGAPVLAHSLRVLANHPQIERTQVVINPSDRDRYEAAAGPFAARLAGPVSGGPTRQESVRHGLEALEVLAPKRVLIHDAARPFLTADLVTRLLAALDDHQGAIAAEPVADTLKRAGADGLVAETVDRANLWRAQTPQAFRFADILSAHRNAAAAGKEDFTDDAGLAEWAGLPVQLVPSSGNNMKLTTREDFTLAERLLGGTGPLLEPRNGSGFDVHAFAPGDHVWLCGVSIPHTQRLEGHSDADVALHALTDAILGAIGDGDIGEHFPPSDAAWRGARLAYLPGGCAAPRAGAGRPHRQRRRDDPVRGTEDCAAPRGHAAVDRVNVADRSQPRRREGHDYGGPRLRRPPRRDRRPRQRAGSVAGLSFALAA